MKKMFWSIVFVGLSVIACNKPEESIVYEAPLKSPLAVTAVQQPFTAVVDMTWKDTNENEEGYTVYLLTKGQEPVVLADLAANTTEYTVSAGIEYGMTYSFGVRAKGKEEKLSSPIIYKEVEIFNYDELPYPSIAADDIIVTKVSIGCPITFKSVKGYEREQWGLCWSSDHTPTIEDMHAHGPKLDRIPIVQFISCAAMEYGKTYKVRAYVITEIKGEKTPIYSQEVSVPLPDPIPAVTFNWTEITDPSYPAEVKVYKTSDRLNGRPINAWYAIADISKGNVEFRVNHPNDFTLATLEKQWTDDCLVLVNGGYFNMTTGNTNDYFAVEGAYWGSFAVQRSSGVFGVDADGVPFAGWVSAGAGGNYLYDYPITYVNGKSVYAAPTPSYPVDCSEWVPYHALSAGPLVLKNGNVVVDDSKDESGQYYNNFEDRATDIFSFGSTPPDRTAAGYTADGKIILFVCDGRLNESEGATISEVGQIMKGLGCVGANNFDGGGSTAMLMAGKRLNSLQSNRNGATENRSVASSIGFYIKK